LADGGQTITTRGVETMTGGSGSDIVFLGDTGVTMNIAGRVEILVGGTGSDLVTLGAGGQTILLRGIETLTGSSDSDIITLGDTVNTMTVNAIDTLFGGAAADTVTVSSGTVRFQGNTGADVLSLASNSAADQVVFATVNDGAAAGATSGFDTVTGFQSQDQIVLTGALRTLLDRNADGAVTGATRATGAVSMTSDEVAIISTAASSLNDTDLAGVRTAIGSLTNSSAGASVLVLANNGSNTGAYVVTDANGDGTVASTEIRLLGVFNGTTSIGTSNIAFG
jgi:Ca2+-binding RTX toxin-like protein